MKPPRKPPTLADYRTETTVSSSDASLWALIGRWQRERLLTVKAVSPGCARVVLTDAGRAVAR